MGDLRYVLEVYINDFISCIVPTSRQQIEHVARGILHGIHDVFQPSADDSKDPILAKKLRKGNSTYESNKCILGFNFDGVNKTIWLEEDNRAALLTILHQWIRGATRSKRGVPFAEFELVTAKALTCFHCTTGRAQPAKPMQLGNPKTTTSCIPAKERSAPGSYPGHPNNPPGLN